MPETHSNQSKERRICIPDGTWRWLDRHLPQRSVLWPPVTRTRDTLSRAPEQNLRSHAATRTVEAARAPVTFLVFLGHASLNTLSHMHQETLTRRSSSVTTKRSRCLDLVTA